MNKKRWVISSAVVLCCVVILVVVISFIKNGNSEKAPLDHLMKALNNNDISEIPKAFHEYCSLAVEQNISEENFENYINNTYQYMGGTFRFSYKITNMSQLSKEDIEMYETIAKGDYDNYPYLLNGGDLEFENIYEVSTSMTCKGKYQEEHDNINFLIVKIDGKYYFLDTFIWNYFTK